MRKYKFLKLVALKNKEKRRKLKFYYYVYEIIHLKKLTCPWIKKIFDLFFGIISISTVKMLKNRILGPSTQTHIIRLLLGSITNSYDIISNVLD